MTRRTLIAVAVSILVAVGIVSFGAVYGIRGIGGNGGQQASGTCDSATANTARLQGLNIGQVAAFQIADSPQFVGDLTWVDEAGGATGMADHRNQTVLLNLWATWCVPCREEMPTLEKLQEDLGSETFQVLPVSMDHGSDEKPKAFYAETGLKALPFRHDGTIATFNRLKGMGIAFGMPATVLVDGQGCALGWMNGPANWASQDAKALVGAVLDP